MNRLPASVCMEPSRKPTVMARVTLRLGITSEQDQDLLKAYLNMAPSQTLKWIESGKMPSEQDVEDPGNRTVHRRWSPQPVDSG